MSQPHRTDDNGKLRSGEFPVVSWPESRQTARERREAYPYRFPRDPRRMKGRFPVQENARRLLRYFYFERRLAQAIGSWTLSIPDFEVLVESGRHIFYHADAANTLRNRLYEQEMQLKKIDDYRDAEIDQLLEEMLSAADAPELLVGLHQVIGRALETAYRRHIGDTDAVADAPTVRLLQRILLDYEPMLEWADAAVDAYIDGGVDESKLAQWRWHLQQLLDSIGGVSGSEPRTERPSPMRSEAHPYTRGTVPLRDARFVSFHHTGDYDVSDGKARFPKKTYESLRLRFVRTQRDEVDAIEAFGTFLWDIRFIDFDAEYQLARITWDEARHTEIGHRSMLTMGYDPFELPNRLTGSTCRGPMEPEYAMAEINLFGEVGVLKTINSFIDEARERNDALLAHIADFIRADERTHVRNGQYILKCMTGLNMNELELKTRELFTECLLSLGVVGKDLEDIDLFTVSRADLEELVGE